MRTIDEWLAEYGASHIHPINKRIHRVAVPIIVLASVGLLHMLPTGSLGLPPASWLFVLATVVFYARLSPGLALGMLVLAVPSLAALEVGVTALGAWAVPTLAAVNVAAWIAQFIGHSLEGKKPSFFKDLQFLLIGPLWLLADAYESVGLRPHGRRRGAASLA